jgi:nucleotide-binding universal stress UspA family protein
MSALRSLLVHVDASARAEERLRVALGLAREHRAELTAMYAVSSIAAEYPFAMVGDPTATAVLLDAEAEIRQRARASFDRVVAETGVGATWVEVDLQPERAVSRQARYADLLVLGQQEPGTESSDGLSGRFVESVLIESGRPALVVPYAGKPSSRPIGKISVVAWKNTREAARALGASLALLTRAERVHVVCWDDASGDERADETGGPLDIERYLALHGVTATMHRHRSVPGDVGGALVSFTADVGADLLVMGCYGHGRAREWVLGGATRSVLRTMTLPVLLAH